MGEHRETKELIMRKIFKKWLGITSLEEENKRLQKSLTCIEERVRALESVIDIGVDVHVRGGSWAVFCVRGKADKSDYIKFVNLDERPLREIQSFVRQFKHCRPAIDTPFGGMPRREFFRL